ncbi:NAD(P)/FAD-dependent oxidoreductase [Paenarthrobacter sp. CM16]|uniref:NAD(P)/FAD-dependent oxidoreductase n=1 Tax=Paenarthrobacter sp. CM16 TaxID=2738447 RepID=UPI0015532410|nr:FAD-dependent oxidoreductase [Paenarthrobacter sp. CM16]NQD89395.1 NAD(P)/FAD-dependent oxidoreductase [Paenarthrobacter sp. CM16]
MKKQLVVIGNGMAGARALEEILARGGGDLFDITVFGDEPYGNYNRMMLGQVLAGEASEAGIILNSLPWYQENNITLHAGVRVDRIDKFSRHVFAADGRVVQYHHVIIATGSRPYLPPMEGLFTPSGTLRRGVFTFRTMDDTRRMMQFAGLGQRRGQQGKVVVLGGELRGVEAARGLRACGLEVHLHAGNRPTAILGSDHISGVSLRDQPDLDCDMVVITAGNRPNVDVAVVSGLAVERGIVVDDHLRVMDEDGIYAVGECAQHRGEVYGHLAPLWDQAAVLADHITGADRSSMYPGSPAAVVHSPLLPASRAFGLIP